MKKCSVIILILIVLTCSILLSACVADKRRENYCFDEKGLFNEAQINQINQACKAATKKYDVTFLVATAGRTGGKADMYAVDLLAKQKLSRNDDYIVIIINAVDYEKDYHFDIYPFGRANARLSDEELYDAAFSIYGDRILTSKSGIAADGVAEMLPMLGKAYDGIPLWGNILIGLIIGLVVGGVVAWRITVNYSRRRKNVTYPLDKYCKMKLKEHEDNFKRSTTTVMVIQSNNGGSRGGGGGFHSSGGGGGSRHVGR